MERKVSSHPGMLANVHHVHSGISTIISKAGLPQTLESTWVILRDSGQAFQLLSAWFWMVCIWPWGRNEDWEYPVCIKCPHFLILDLAHSCPLLHQEIDVFPISRKRTCGIIYLLGPFSQTLVFVQVKLVCSLFWPQSPQKLDILR